MREMQVESTCLARSLSLLRDDEHRTAAEDPTVGVESGERVEVEAGLGDGADLCTNGVGAEGLKEPGGESEVFPFEASALR